MWTIHDGRVHSVKYNGNDRHVNSVPKKRHDGRVCNHFLLFIHCTALFLSALFVLLFGITASASSTWTHHHGAILLDLRVGSFLEEEGKEEEVLGMYESLGAPGEVHQPGLRLGLGAP